MKIWITAPFDDAGLVEAETLSDPTGDVFSYVARGRTATSIFWYREGVTWHRTKKAAIDAARKHRIARLQKAAAEHGRLLALPQIGAPS